MSLYCKVIFFKIYISASLNIQRKIGFNFYLVQVSLKQRASPLLIFEPAARVLKLAGDLAPQVSHVLDIHLKDKCLCSPILFQV